MSILFKTCQHYDSNGCCIKTETNSFITSTNEHKKSLENDSDHSSEENPAENPSKIYGEQYCYVGIKFAREGQVLSMSHMKRCAIELLLFSKKLLCFTQVF